MKGIKNLFKAAILGCAFLLVGCNTPTNPAGSSSNATPVVGDANWVDYAHNGSVKLELDYKGRSFFKDGVSQFNLKTAIDGDTAHFTEVNGTGETMKARFYGIDTPESTGKVQEYGKPASNYTKEMLKLADSKGTIVISSAQSGYGVPNPDSTGERYVSLVWINTSVKNAPYDQLVLLNLLIVQEGFSWVKNVQDMPQYQETFYQAENQAKVYKLNLFSGEPDPLFNYGDYFDVSLLEVKQELQKTLDDPTHQNIYDGAKIRFQGTVAGFSNNILYLQDYVLYDNDDPSKGGEYCGINIFVGMSDIASKYKKINTYVQVCGLAQNNENFGFQVTDTQGRFPFGSATSDNDAKIIYTPEQNADTEHNLYKFEYTSSELSAVASAKNPYNLENLNCYTIVTNEVKVSRVFISTSYEITLYFENCSFNCYIPFNYKGDPENPTYRWVKEEDFLGKTFTVQGVYVSHKTTSGKINFQIIPNGVQDLVCTSL